MPHTLDSGLPPQNVRPDPLLEHQDSASHTAQKGKRKKEVKNQTNLQKKKKEETGKTPRKIVKATFIGQEHTNKLTNSCSQKNK